MKFCALHFILKNPQSTLFMRKWYCLPCGYFSLHTKLVKPILHDQVLFGGYFKNMWTYFKCLIHFSFSSFKLLAFYFFFPVAEAFFSFSPGQPAQLAGPSPSSPRG